MNDTKTELVSFFRRFGALLGCGMPILHALRAILAETTNEQVKAMIAGVGASVESGHSLSESFAVYPGFFSPTILAIVASGEAAGNVDEVLPEIAKRIEDGILPAVMTGSAQASEDAEKDWARPVGQVNAMLFEAFQSHASDIHIEPNATHGLRIRFRIDGVLQEKPELAVPAELAGAFASRIKIMANMNTHETPQPQDGRIQINIQGTHVHLRVNVAPCVTGESIVLRLMQRASSILLDLDALGFSPRNQETLRSWCHWPDGLIIVTGPTDSGLTTTLYAMLQEINSPKIKVVTVEDPVEFQFDGISQMQINPSQGLTCAQALRCQLKQAPNVIMISEIRDLETANMAIEAALTGHLVLTSLHTNDAPMALRRLLDIGVKPFLVASAVRGVVAQRLVRRICPDCREECAPPQCQWTDEAVKELKGIKCLHGKGCKTCNQVGYRGQIGVYELLSVDDQLRRLICDDAGHDALRKQAVASGMLTLHEDGLAKVNQGLTTPEELRLYGA